MSKIEQEELMLKEQLGGMPMEYEKSRSKPFITVPEADASISAEPRNAPTQGVWLIENTIPKANAESVPFIS